MIKKHFILFCIACISGLSAQEVNLSYATKKIAVAKDTILIDNNSINPNFFKLISSNKTEVDTAFYEVNFSKATLLLKPNAPIVDSIEVQYLKYPAFLTKTYSIYNESKVVPNAAGNLYTINEKPSAGFKPFDGLTTTGSISRGVTIGNNQNTVVNSNLDLQVTGKISDKVSLRASIQDSNIPLQDGGYSQKIDEFDQIFIELFSDKWAIRAGDLFLENRQSKFLNFNKKVQGISTQFNFGNTDKNTTVTAAAALVRGQYAKSAFTGQEGNQGPYKLRGNNGKLYVLVISGSERVFVNGVLLKRGENNDYIIDYNAGEIIFTSLFPITSEMRIAVEYQYTDRNYTRFVTYGGVHHKQEKFSIGTYIYSENDVKNQPLQQNLSAEQIEILQNAGDNISQMNAPSAYLDTYSENKILYKKVLIGLAEVFEFSNNPLDELYNVRFSIVGTNLGNYILTNNNAIGKIFEYVAPISGVLQGNYEPIIPLIAPTKIQIATVLGSYTPNEKTDVAFELAVSKNDQNLYSPEDDNNNQGIAAKINAKKRIFTGRFNLDAFANYQLVQENFKSIERLYNIEFDRDWNLNFPLGNQSLLISGLQLKSEKNGFATYQFEKLDFSKNFEGNRHVFNSLLKYNNTTFLTNLSALKSTSLTTTSQFLRNQSQLKHTFSKNWIGVDFSFEDNKEKDLQTDLLLNNSQRFREWGGFVGRGDSTKVYLQIGYLNRVNDSLENGLIKRVNYSNSYYLKSQLIKTERTNLSVFVNYRNLVFENTNQKEEPSLNSRILYNSTFFKSLLQSSTAYETSSGTIAQQEFTYLEVAPGQGVYTWNDYNGNGIQELQEFEIAPFIDQAKYVRIFLPNQVFVRTHQNKFSQSLNINGGIWQNNSGFKKILSHFYNQSSFLMERKIKREANNFDLNPFSNSEESLGLNSSFRNTLFFNRGKQKHSTSYTYLYNNLKNLLNIGFQSNVVAMQQLQYAHLLKKTWLFQFNSNLGSNKTNSENYSSRNFELSSYMLSPKLGFLFSKNASLDVFYELQNQENTIGLFEELNQNRLGTSFTLNSEKGFTMNGEFSLYDNKFTGNATSPVAFQMLQGLQPGKNSVWRLLFQKTITEYLDITLNYQGRKSETAKAIHTGNVQLRAFF